MFASCLGSITGVDNRLGLKRADRVLAILIDGLGTHNLRLGGGHAPTLGRLLEDSGSIHTGFPSTTATSITSFATGLRAGSHGIVGYKVLDPVTRQPVNQLTGWSKEFDPLTWQPNQTISERATQASVSPYVVGPAEYARSGFTSLTMRGAAYVSAKSIFDRFEAALDILSRSEKSLTYLYVPELDQKAHAFGVDSVEWLRSLEDLESAVSKLVAQLGTKRFATAAAVLTADHGVIDVPRSKHIFLDELVMPELELVAGEPRANYLYLAKQTSLDEIEAIVSSIQHQLDEKSSGTVRVASKQQLIEAQWFGGEVTAAAAARMPDVFALATGRVAMYHREFVPAKGQGMIGQHGSISAEETQVPLLKLGAFAR